MKPKLLALIAACYAALVPPFMDITSADRGLERNLAILQFQNNKVDAAYADALAQNLEGAFVRGKRYLVIDRKSLQTILAEQKIQVTDCTDTACAVRAGKILNTQWVVTGNVYLLENTYIFMAKMINVESTQIVSSSTIQATNLTALLDKIPVMVEELSQAPASNTNLKTRQTSGAAPEAAGAAPVKTTDLPPVRSSLSQPAQPPPAPKTARSSPPKVKFVETPKALMNLLEAKTVQFRFVGDDAPCIEEYRYRLDDQDVVKTKRAAAEVNNLGAGSHTFQVQAVDCEGNVSDNLRFTFEVRNQRPQAIINSPKANERIAGQRLRVELQGRDADGTIAAYRCGINKPGNVREQQDAVFLLDAPDGKVKILAQVVDDGGAESEWETQEVEFSFVDTSNQGASVIPEGFVLIPAGRFMIGSPTSESCRIDSEGPAHEIQISKPFFMSTAETTCGQFALFLQRTGYKSEAAITPANFPVNKVTWHEAIKYCNWLSSCNGLRGCYSGSDDTVTCDFNVNGFRLPTEAEWEYACRAGTTTKFYSGDDLEGCGENSRSTALDEVAWYLQNANGDAHPVRQKKPNAWGLYDMLGNVMEWCWDRYSEGYYKISPSVDPLGPTLGAPRVLRGGNWHYRARNCRAAYRIGYLPSTSHSNVGFRVVRSAS